MSSPIEQKAPARSVKRAVQLTLSFSVAPVSSAKHDDAAMRAAGERLTKVAKVKSPG